MKKALPSVLLYSFSSAGLLLSAAVSAEQSSVVEFDKVVVSASRVQQTAQKDSRSIDSVDRETLDELQPTSVAEALKYQPNVTVAGGPVPGNQSVNIRGLSGNKVLQVIDGTRVNTNFSHRPSYVLDASLVGSLDVVKGPVSSLWGSGAIGGVVSQQTISSDDILQQGETLGGFIKAGYNDNGDQKIASGAVTGRQGGVDWLLGASYLDSGNMEQGGGDTLWGSETQNRTGLAKINWQINDTHQLGLNYRIANDEGHPPTVGSADEGDINRADNQIDRKIDDEHLALSYQFTPNSQWFDLESNLYQNTTRIVEVNLDNGRDVSEIDTVGFSVTNKSSLDKLHVFSGIDGYHDTYDTSRPSAGNGRPNPPENAKTTTGGAFVYVDYQLLESVVVEAGVRFDDFQSKAKGFDDNNESAWSPSLGVSWQATEWMAWSLRYDEAFRAPDVYELYMSGTHFAFFPGGPSNVFVANPELDPEKSKNLELKGEFSFSNLLAEDSVNITAAVFENKVDDFIELSVYIPQTLPSYCFAPGMGAGCAGTSTSDNISNAKLTGFELSAVYELSALTAAVSYGQTRGENDDTGEYLAGIPADKWVASVDYGFWSIDTKAGLRIIDAQEQNHLPEDDTEGPYNGYTTTEFYAEWEPTTEDLTGLKVNLTVANAFDQSYRSAWSSVYEAGRSIRASAQYTF